MLPSRFAVALIIVACFTGSVIVKAQATTTPIKIMFCGLGRTGSHSLAEALTRLGYTPCHGSDIVNNILGSHKALAESQIHRTKSQNITLILEETSKLGCDVTMEAHSSYCPKIFYGREKYYGLIDDGTKFIFTLRKPMENWLQSFASMRNAVAPINRYPLRFISAIEATFQWSSQLAILNFVGAGATIDADLRFTPEEFVSGTAILENPTIRQYHEQTYQENYDFTMKAISEDPQHTMLLDLDTMNQFGYQPLCEFLGVATTDCPTSDDEPYPNAGSSSAMADTGRILLLMEIIVYLFMLAVGYGLWKLGQRIVITVKLRCNPGTSSANQKKVL